MINVRLISRDKGEFSAFEAAGHAGKAEYSKDIVCSAVTVLLKTAVLTLKAAEKKGSLKVKTELKNEGMLSAYVENYEEAEKSHLHFLFEFLAAGLMSIENEYPCCLSLEIVEI